MMSKNKFKLILVTIASFVFAEPTFSAAPNCAKVYENEKIRVSQVLELAEKSERLLQKHGLKFDQLIKTLGFQSYAEYEVALRSIQDPVYRQVIQIIDQGQLQVVTRASDKIRDHIAESGFLNQFETQTSRGMLNNDYRNQVESDMLGVSVDSYRSLDPKIKPKYGMVVAKASSGTAALPINTAVKRYGSDIYYFKLDKIEKRLTYTAADSFMFAPNDALAEDPYVHTIWSRFVPWNRRLLLVPFVVENMKKKNEFSVSGVVDKTILKQEVDEFYSRYIEAQIFGPLNLDMVERIDFEETLPSGKFLHELRSRGIKIYDKRSGSPVLMP